MAKSRLEQIAERGLQKMKEWDKIHQPAKKRRSNAITISDDEKDNDSKSDNE